MRAPKQRTVVSTLALIGGFAGLTFLVQSVRKGAQAQTDDPFEDDLKRQFG